MSEPTLRIRPEVMAFAEAMELTLRKHDHKGGWSECGLEYLLDGVEREYKEARDAWNAIKKQKDYYRVSEELVDVANFCMMFWEQMELTKADSFHSRPAPQPDAPKFNSTDLLLLAHDEWKRREERKHTHEEPAWVAGFLNGFCTDKKWARWHIEQLRKQQAGE